MANRKKAKTKKAKRQAAAAAAQTNESTNESTNEPPKQKKADNKEATTVKDTNKAQTAVEAVEDETTELEEQTVAELAAVTNTVDAVMAELVTEAKTEPVEELEIKQIAALEGKLKEMFQYSEINQATSQYMHEFFSQLAKKTEESAMNEARRHESHTNMIDGLKQSLKDLEQLLKFSRLELRKLRQKARKERASFKREITALKNTIRLKKAALAQLLRKSKANPQVIAQLRRQILILENNLVQTKKVQAELIKTHAILDQEILKLQEIIKALISGSTTLKRKTAPKLSKRENSIKGRLAKLISKQRALSQAVDNFKSSTNTHRIILTFSEKMKDYFEFYIPVLKENLDFNKVVKETLTRLILIEKNLKTFVQLEDSLNFSEIAIENGTGAILSILSAMTKENVARDLQREWKNIKDETAILQEDSNIVEWLKGVDKEIEERSIAMVKTANELIAREEKTIATNQALEKEQNQHLGSSAAIMVGQKVQSSAKYQAKAEAFHTQLNNRNDKAAAAYQQAMKDARSLAA